MVPTKHVLNFHRPLKDTILSLAKKKQINKKTKKFFRNNIKVLSFKKKVNKIKSKNTNK